MMFTRKYWHTPPLDIIGGGELSKPGTILNPVYIADHVTTDKVNWSDIFTTDSAEEIPRETIEDQKVIKEPMF